MKVIDILMVEDEDAIIKLYESILQFLPYSFLLVKKGEEVIDLIKTHTFRVCILDINLHSNDINGLDLSILLKKENKAEKVFAMTGYPFVFEGFNPTIAGFDAIFSKPTQFKIMFKTIDDYLKLK